MFKNLIIFLFLPISFLSAQTTQTIRGKVVDNDNEKALVGATISLINTSQNAQSDDKGVFYLEKVPVGRYQLQVSFVGYETQKITELLLESGKELILEIRLKESSKQLNEATIKAASNNLSGALTSINNITIEQVMRYPATYMDPARLATTFAGVANDNDQANGMVIRGNSPNGVQWRLEGVEIVNPNHLSNAGTFSDRPTQNAGGVNILSAQLLGNMNLLTGAFPAEYGNAISGVMDMRLRKGNDKNHEFTAQAGIIGVDLAAEGPLSKKSGASYLVNYRYSFTGLLGVMGVKFGDEDIRFQDVAFNLSFPTKKAGNFTVFGMYGLSSNDFTAKEDKSLWTSEKDQNTINFENTMWALGASYQSSTHKNLYWKHTLGISALNNTRFQSNPISSTKFFSDRWISSYSSVLNYSKNKSHIKTGLFLSLQENDNIFSQANVDVDRVINPMLVLQPFFNYNYSITDKISTNLGLHSYLNTNGDQTIEPRFSLNYRLNNIQSVNFAYGKHSQFINMLNSQAFIKSHQFALNHQIFFNNNSFFKTEVYYQSLFNIPIKDGSAQQLKGYSYSFINLSDEKIPNKLTNDGTGRNYGIELTYQHYLTNGFYSLINTSLYKSTYVAADGIERSTRFDGNYIFNATLGKEFTKTKNRIWGVNVRLTWLGGYRETPVDAVASEKEKITVYNESKAWSVKQKDYIRPDLRVYFKKSKTKNSRTFSIDIQNVMNRQNESFNYYDTYLKKVVRKYQLGLLPLINYRWEF
jgi:hypothetical protein